MIFLCAKVPGWLEKYWLSAQSLVLEEAGRTCRCEGGRADGNRWRWAATGPGHAAGAVHGSVLEGNGCPAAGWCRAKTGARAGLPERLCPAPLSRQMPAKGRAGGDGGRQDGRTRTDLPWSKHAESTGAPPRMPRPGEDGARRKGAPLRRKRGLFPDRPGGRARQWLAAPRRHRQRCGRGSSSVSRHCGVSEGAQSGARSSKAV